MAATDVVSSIQREVEIVKKGLKSVDENIKKLTGRDPSESRGPVGNRRVLVKRNLGERIGGPPQKRFNAGSAYNRLGPRLSSNNREQRFGQLESDGEEEEDDSKKPTLQSSVVAKPAPSRLQQDANADKKTQTRNKRMFGVLLGTLQKFKESSNKEAAREKKRQEIEKKLEEVAMKEREEASRQRKELFYARKEKQTKLENLERKMEVAEMLEDWDDHDRKISKFIRTKTKPRIFYIPAKHNEHTLDLLEKTAQQVEDEIEKRRKEVEGVLHKPEVDEEEGDVVETKQDGNDKDTHEGDQEMVGRWELGGDEEGEDEDNVKTREGKAQGDGEELAEGEANEKKVREVKNEKMAEGDEKMGEGQDEKMKGGQDEKIEEGQDEGEVDREEGEKKEEGEENERRDENTKSEIKDDELHNEEKMVPGVIEEQDAEQSEKDSVNAVDDKKVDT